MKLRGAGWIIGTAVTLTAFSTVAACDDGTDASGVPLADSGITLPDGGGADATGNNSDGNVTPPDSGKDSTADASKPAQCNDGTVDLGETCDPLEKCPTECTNDKCQLKALQNAGTCAAVCTVVAEQTQCQNGDGCCPPGCSIANDGDCLAECGNKVKEPGEKCDGDCPTDVARDCPPIACDVRKIAGLACQAECVFDTKITTCNAQSDGCCAPGCTSGNDPDCAAGVCGNNVFDPPAELCDTGIPAGQPNACPVTCTAADKCQPVHLDKAGTCQAACVPDPEITECRNGDGCCAKGCNNANDNDCPAVCGNGVTEPPGESCDANCPTDCKPQEGCFFLELKDKGTCTAKCVVSGEQKECISGDGCCPLGCTGANDTDCAASTCGNGKLDTGETCDPSTGVPCPKCNTKTACITQTGSEATCDVVCDVAVNKCSNKSVDACCPFASASGADCNTTNDADCNGDAWKSIEHPLGVELKVAGACEQIVIGKVEQGGAYDITTCGKGDAIGDVEIKSVMGQVLGRPTNYGSNDNCSETKLSLPNRAGLTCKNTKGDVTMACVANGPGGFFARSSSDLVVEICAVGGAAKTSVTLFYNARQEPVFGKL